MNNASLFHDNQRVQYLKRIYTSQIIIDALKIHSTYEIDNTPVLRKIGHISFANLLNYSFSTAHTYENVGLCHRMNQI